MVVFDRMLNRGAGVLPKLTLSAVEKFAPVRVKTLPPAVVSELIDRLLIVGGADWKVKCVCVPMADMPSGDSIVISTVATTPTGDVTLRVVDEVSVNATGVWPKSTRCVP